MAGGSIANKIAQKGKKGALEASTHGLIGYVVNYHRQGDTCDCNRHKGAVISKNAQHTVDIEVYQGSRQSMYYEVPCFVYSQGIIDKGLEVNDRVWVQFIGGDANTPIVTAYYREPSDLENYFRNLYFAVSDFFNDLI